MSKIIIALSLVATLFATGCGGNTTQPQDMTQFNHDLGVYMGTVVAKDLGDGVTVTADCAPLQNDSTTCKIVMKSATDSTTATAENVRRSGDKFVWDHES